MALYSSLFIVWIALISYEYNKVKISTDIFFNNLKDRYLFISVKFCQISPIVINVCHAIYSCNVLGFLKDSKMLVFPVFVKQC